VVDERFIAHRYKATRLATAVGVVLMVGFFFYGHLADGVIRWDLLIILCAMAVTKVVAMLVLGRTG